MGVITAEAILEEVLAKLDELAVPMRPEAEWEALQSEFAPRLGQRVEEFPDDDDGNDDDEDEI